eukprot:m.899840 g.899840  ORF g.899840 m.899840 type:complete len:990 (+) comp23683_c0_seq1:351-3320(+)
MSSIDVTLGETSLRLERCSDVNLTDIQLHIRHFANVGYVTPVTVSTQTSPETIVLSAVPAAVGMPQNSEGNVALVHASIFDLLFSALDDGEVPLVTVRFLERGPSLHNCRNVCLCRPGGCSADDTQDTGAHEDVISGKLCENGSETINTSSESCTSPMLLLDIDASCPIIDLLCVQEYAANLTGVTPEGDADHVVAPISRVARKQLLRSLHGRLCGDDTIGICRVLRHDVRYRVRAIATTGRNGINAAAAPIAGDSRDKLSRRAETGTLVRLCTASALSSAQLHVRACCWSSLDSANCSPGQRSVAIAATTGTSTQLAEEHLENSRAVPKQELSDGSGGDGPPITHTEALATCKNPNPLLAVEGVTHATQHHDTRAASVSRAFEQNVRHAGQYLAFFRAQHEMLDVVLASAYHSSTAPHSAHIHGMPAAAGSSTVGSDGATNLPSGCHVSALLSGPRAVGLTECAALYARLRGIAHVEVEVSIFIEAEYETKTYCHADNNVDVVLARLTARLTPVISSGHLSLPAAMIVVDTQRGNTDKHSESVISQAVHRVLSRRHLPMVLLAVLVAPDDSARAGSRRSVIPNCTSIPVDPPIHAEERLGMLRWLLQKQPHAPVEGTAPLASTEADLPAVAQRTHGFALGDLRRLCRVLWCKAMAARVWPLATPPHNTPRPETMTSDNVQDSNVIQTDVPLPWREHLSRLNRYVRPAAIAVYPPLAAPPSGPGVDPVVVGGYHHVRERLSAVLSAVRHACAIAGNPQQRHALKDKSALDKPPSGVLLYGPSGCGKSLIARTVIAAAGINTIAVAATVDILSKYVGDTESNIRRIFTAARRSRPVVIFIDEIDTLVMKRSLGGDDGGTGVGKRALSQLLNEMDGIEDSEGIVVVGCTNRNLEDLDPAAVRPGRLELHLHLALPTPAERREIALMLANAVATCDATAVATHVAENTEGKSGADIAAIFRKAGLAALDRVTATTTNVDAESVQVELCDFPL